MKQDEYYCSNYSLASAEDLIGTASVCKGFILIGYNEPFPARVVDAKIASIAAILQFSKTIGFKVLLIRSEENIQGSVYFVDCSRREWFKVNDNNQEGLIATIQHKMNATDTLWENDILWLVCTNGKKDKCCSLKGFPVYKELKAIQTKYVFQCSHMGGDRFAANMAVLPYGYYFGRVQGDEVAEITHTIQSGKIYSNGFRGHTLKRFEAQAMEYFIRSYTNNWHIEASLAIIILGYINHTWSAIIDFEGRKYQLEIESYTFPYNNLLTCNSGKNENPLKYRLGLIREFSE